MSEWTREILTGFIETYRKHNCLWQVKSKEYTDRYLKQQAYDDLVEYCKKYFPKSDRYMVVRKIQNLRAAFRKEANKVKKSLRSGVAEKVHVPSLWYYDLLRFTQDQDVSDAGSPDYDSDAIDDNAFKVLDSVEVDIKENEDIEMQKQEISVIHLKKKRKIEDTQSEISFRNVPSPGSSQSDEVDEFKAISINIAAKLKKMTPKQAFLAESLIAQIITKGLFNELTRKTSIVDGLD